MGIKVLPMGSTLILNVRIYLKSFTSFTILTQSQLLPSARFFCTRDPKLGGREVDRRNRVQTIKQVRIKNNSIRRQEDEMDPRGISSALQQRPSFPKSVFAAGTAKRTAEMLRRKLSLAAEEEEHDEEAPEQRASRRAGN